MIANFLKLDRVAEEELFFVAWFVDVLEGGLISLDEAEEDG